LAKLTEQKAAERQKLLLAHALLLPRLTQRKAIEP
jgi:hypothetical protein